MKEWKKENNYRQAWARKRNGTRILGKEKKYLKFLAATQFVCRP